MGALQSAVRPRRSLVGRQRSARHCGQGLTYRTLCLGERSVGPIGKQRAESQCEPEGSAPRRRAGGDAVDGEGGSQGLPVEAQGHRAPAAIEPLEKAQPLREERADRLEGEEASGGRGGLEATRNLARVTEWQTLDRKRPDQEAQGVSGGSRSEGFERFSAAGADLARPRRVALAPQTPAHHASLDRCPCCAPGCPAPCPCPVRLATPLSHPPWPCEARQS